MAIIVTINSVDRTSKTMLNSVNLSLSLGADWSADFQVRDTDSTSSAYRPSLGHTVVIADGATTIFSGTIANIEDRPLAPPHVGTLSVVTARAYSAVVDQVLVNETYAAGETLESVVTDLQSTYLDDYGITLDASMATGATLEAQTFKDVTLREALNQLSTITGWLWRITPGNELQFFAAGTKTASYSLTAANRLSDGPVTWTQTRDKYVNSVRVRYGTESQVPKTQTITGNGVATEWALDYDSARNIDNYILSAGYVTDDGVFSPLSPYPGGSTNWQYDPTTNHLLRTSGALPNGDVATFVYNAQFPQVVTVEDAGEITANGKYGALFEAPGIFDKDAATELGTGLLRRYLEEPKWVRTATRQGFVMPGDQITLTFADRTVSGSHIITEVKGQGIAKGTMRYSLTCLSGDERQETWTEQLRAAIGTGGSFAAGGTISGSALPNYSGRFDGDVSAYTGLSDTSTGYESALTTYTNSAGEGAALRLGRNDQDWRWVIVADADYGSSPGTVGRLRFQLPTIGSAISAVFQVVDDGSDNYVLLPGEGLAALGGFWIGDPTGLITGASPDNKIAGIYTDILKATDGVYERGRTVRQGDWTTVAFSAGNFTASGSMTWTVASGDQITYQYMLLGSTMFVEAVIDTSTVGGTLDTLLKIAIPGGFTAVSKATFGAKIRDNNVVTSGFAQVLASGTTIDIGRDDNAAFSASTDLTYVRVSMFFEVQ